MLQQEIGVILIKLFHISRLKIKKGLTKMIPDDAKQIVKTRYDKFAETGGSKDSC